MLVQAEAVVGADGAVAAWAALLALQRKAVTAATDALEDAQQEVLHFPEPSRTFSNLLGPDAPYSPDA